MSVVLADAVFDIIQDPRAVQVYVYLAFYADEQRVARPSIRKMAAELNCAVETVRKTVVTLNNTDVLQIHQRFSPDGGRIANAYHLTLDPQVDEVRP